MLRTAKAFTLSFGIIVGGALMACNFSIESKSQVNSSVQWSTAERDSLKTAILDLSENQEEVPGDYLTYFGFRDWYRWPLIYPFSLNSIDERDNGFLCNERSAVDISGSQKGIDQIYLGAIKKFTFNSQVLIAETGESGKKKYKMFRFEDREITSYGTSKELREAAAKYGEMIIDSMVTLEEYGLIF
ncbi:MAG: hypothetical protein ACFHU9_05950 [Fluviicola sp.]